MKKALVCGAGGFIGGHLINRLKDEGYWVRGVDLKHHEFMKTRADEFVIADLRESVYCLDLTKDIDEVYQLAADMGGAGYIFTGDNDAAIMHNSAIINLNIAEGCRVNKVPLAFYSSSACIYPEHNQVDPNNPNCEESSAYPADPDSEYGWEKLFSERMWLAYAKNCGIKVHVARFHNVFGPYGTWDGGREKVPAAMCRKVAQSTGEIEMWGDGKQTRSFLYIDECIEGVRRFVNSDFMGPLNIGSDEMVTINKLVDIVSEIAGKTATIKHIDGPLGVRGRCSHNDLIEQKLGWRPTRPLAEGLKPTYEWIKEQIDAGK